MACVGSIEVLGDDGEVGRMRIHANDELWLELQRKAGLVRVLIALPSERKLTYGIPVDAIDVPGQDPLFFADEGIALPLWFFIHAYPDGPASVPATPTRVVGTVGTNAFVLSTSRPGPGRIAFRIGPSDGTPDHRPIEGALVYPRLAPLPDDEPLDGWITKSGERFTRLGEARRRP